MPTHKHYTQYNDTHETQCVVQRVVKGVVKIGHRPHIHYTQYNDTHETQCVCAKDTHALYTIYYMTHTLYAT